jgi:hypothetical protein
VCCCQSDPNAIPGLDPAIIESITADGAVDVDELLDLRNRVEALNQVESDYLVVHTRAD